MTSPGSPLRTSPRAAIVVAGLVLATLGATLPQSMTAPVIGMTAEAFETTTAEASWTLTIVLVVAVATTPLIGRIGDRYGARRVLLVLLPIVGAGLLLAALAPTIGWVVVARAIQGLGGGVLPLSVAIVRNIVPDRDRASAVGLVTATYATGIGFGVVVSGLLADNLGLRALSWVPLLVVALAEVVLVVSLRHVPRVHGVHIDARAAIALAVGVVAILLAVTEAPRLPYPVAWVGGCVAVAVVSLGWWRRRERHSPDPLIGPQGLRRRQVWSTHLTAFLIGAALLGMLVLVPAFAEAPNSAAPADGLSATVTAAGLLLLPATVTMLVVGPLAGILRRWMGARLPVVLGTVLAAGGALWMLAGARELFGMIGGTVLVGAGIATASAGLINVIVDVVDADQVGSATGVNVVARQLGGAVGAALIAAVLVWHSDEPNPAAFGEAFTVVAVITLLAVASALLIPGDRIASRRR